VQRIVRLGGAVDDDNSNLLVAQLLYLDSIGKKDITMYVNSPGGSVTAGRPLPHHHLSTGIVLQITCHCIYINNPASCKIAIFNWDLLSCCA